MKKLWVFAAIVLVVLCAPSVALGWQPAGGNLGTDVYHEYFPSSVTGWRGVAGEIYLYDWQLTHPPSQFKGSHVSSLYIHQTPYNPFDAHNSVKVTAFNDGYNDGQWTQWRHLEVGFYRDSTSSWKATRFVAWNNNPLTPEDQQVHELGSTNNVNRWTGRWEISNYDMTNADWQRWTVYYDGNFVDAYYLQLQTGEALVSSERKQLDGSNGTSSLPKGDDNRAEFRNLQRKNSNGAWRDWMQAEPIADGDPAYKFVKVDGSQTHLRHQPY